MAQYIKTLIENDTDTIYPVTKASATYMDDGTTTVQSYVTTLNGNLIETKFEMHPKTTTITGSGTSQVITETYGDGSTVVTSQEIVSSGTKYTSVITLSDGREFLKETLVPTSGSPVVETVTEVTE